MPSPSRDIEGEIESGVVTQSEKRPAWKTQCGARTRHNHHNNGGYCQLSAGFGTDHPGTGRCKYHGGATGIKSGRYSKLGRVGLAEAMDQHMRDPEPLELASELALTRAHLSVLVEEEGEGEGDNTETIRKLIETANKLIATMLKVEAVHSVPVETVQRIMRAMGQVVEDNVHDIHVRARIKEAWLQIRM